MTALSVVLVVVGATLVVLEAHASTHGALGGTGAALLVLGAVLGIAALGGGLALVLAAAAVLGLGAAGFFALALPKAASARRRRVRTGAEGLVGHVGVVRSWAEPTGNVLIDGALWRARRAAGDDGDDELHAGDAVVVERLSGLTVAVRRAEEWEVMP